MRRSIVLRLLSALCVIVAVACRDSRLRNVVAHELGHVLGLEHNRDFATLMCGRPASCRPAAFASDTLHFFPLTAEDEQFIRQRWP